MISGHLALQTVARVAGRASTRSLYAGRVVALGAQRHHHKGGMAQAQPTHLASASAAVTNAARAFSASAATQASEPASNARPPYDKVLQDIANYVHDYKLDIADPAQKLAFETARDCLIDTLGCGLEGLRVSENCRKIVQPIVPGTKVPHGTRVPGTAITHDPIRGAFAIGAMIRWLDFNDCFLAAEWGHPSDNLGAILAVADHLSRAGQSVSMADVLRAMIQAHEIQGGLALLNSFNRVGLDHVVLVKVASTAAVSRLLGLTKEQTMDAVSLAWVDGQSLRTYRHSPNTGSRKSWAAGDACSRAVNIAYLVKNGEMGYPSVLTAPIWGFYDVLFKGKEFQFERPFGSYIMENVLFKISFPAEFHAQTAVESACKIHKQMTADGKSSDDIKSVEIHTQEAGHRIIDKKGPLHNFADRDHCIQYMTAIGLMKGNLTTEDYNDSVASDPKVDQLRDKMTCQEDKRFSTEYLDPELRAIGNRIKVTLEDGKEYEEEISYPVGHKNRRDEGRPLLKEKFFRHIGHHFDDGHVKKIESLSTDLKKLGKMQVKDYMSAWVKKD